MEFITDPTLCVIVVCILLALFFRWGALWQQGRTEHAIGAYQRTIAKLLMRIRELESSSPSGCAPRSPGS